MTEYERKINKLYALLELDIDAETKAAIRWAIFELEKVFNEKQIDS